MATTTVSPITTHVLDTSKGRPAEGISTRLERKENDQWRELAKGTTNSDGRIADLLGAGSKLDPGVYRLTFDTRRYFGAAGIKTFYPYIQVTFEIEESSQHYHVPLLLSPYGYSTYRGS